MSKVGSTCVLLLITTCLYSQTFQDSAFPYLARGISFYINADNVRLRKGPGVEFEILTVLKEDEAVIPLLTSDYVDSSMKEDGPRFRYWYQCALAANPATVGWIYGKYISGRLSTDQELWIVDYDYEGLGRIGDRPAEFRANYKFLHGDFVTKDAFSQLEITFAAHRMLPLLNQDGAWTTKTGEIEIRGTDRNGRLVTALRAGRYPSGTYPDAVVGRHFVAIQGDQCQRARTRKDESSEKAKQRLSFVREYVRQEFQKVSGKSVDLKDIRVDEESRCTFDVFDEGLQLPSTIFYYVFLGVAQNWSIQLGCFLVEHPDGTIVRTNVFFTPSPGDYNEHGGRTGSIYWSPDGPGSYQLSSLLDSADLPATLIHMSTVGYGMITRKLYVTNGYVVFDMGEYDSGEIPKYTHNTPEF